MSVCKDRPARYEHGPPGGGRTLAHNRFYKHCPPAEGKIPTHYQIPH